MSAFDLNFLSLYRINGNEWPVMPGLLALNPPRKVARGREQDRLIVYLTLAGSVAYTPAEYGEITAQIANRFYETSGSITLGLKTAVESLNAYLIERNSKGQQYSVAALVLAALRGNALYITQCGPTHAYWLMSGEARHFYDAGLAGKGLGLNEKAQMYFSQINLSTNDRLLFCAAMPPNWEKSFADERGTPTLEVTRRRLLAITDTNVSAVLFQAMEGSGAMNVLRASSQAPVASLPSHEGVQQIPVDPNQLAVNSSPSPNVGEDEKVADVGAKAQAAPAQTPPARPAAKRKEAAPEKSLLSPQQREKLKTGIRQAAASLARALQASRGLSERVSNSTQRLIPRLLPGEQDTGQTGLPSSWLAFIAIATPLLLLTIGALVYLQIGKPAVFDAYYQKASAAADDAKSEQDPTALRKDWETVIYWLTTAEEQYLVPEREAESHALRQKAQKALDQLNRIVRVQYRPAFNTTLRRLKVTRMAATDVDLYLLDNDAGSVIHGILNGQAYSTDPGFDTCKPGTYNGIQVGKLTDMIALPRSNASGASLIAIDGGGNLLYCASDETPKAVSLQKPDKGWQSITAIAYDANNLYLLDSLGRAVWVFFGTVDIQFPDKPYFFFESQVPDGMEQVTGMTVNGDDLYLLHKDDGHLTTCTLSRIEASPTLCTDPATLVDTRPGYESGEILTADAEFFSQITFTSPPDPAVALLQPHTRSIYRFSARALELQHEIAPPPDEQNQLPDGDITAMAFGPNKVVFVFVAGQVYYAVNVP